jgi:hypothetical protein
MEIESGIVFFVLQLLECRPSLDQILNHRFFLDNYTPRSLPDSALEVPPPSRSPLSERTASNNILERNAHGKRITDLKEKGL